MSETPTFVYMLKPVRAGFINDMSPEEGEILDEHFAYLKKRLTEGALILAGPCLDGEFGIVLFCAKSQEEAEIFMKNDPAVRKGIMTAQLHPFRISLMEKLK